MRFSWTPSIVVALRSLARDRAALALCALALAYAVSSVVSAVSPTAARFFMGRFHLRTESFLAWAVYQPGPWMYNFDNRYWVSRQALSRAELDAPPPGVFAQQVNHQSARVITFADARQSGLRDAGPHYFYLQSRYRDASVLSEYLVEVEPGPANVPRAASVHLLRSVDE